MMVKLSRLRPAMGRTARSVALAACLAVLASGFGPRAAEAGSLGGTAHRPSASAVDLQALATARPLGRFGGWRGGARSAPPGFGYRQRMAYGYPPPLVHRHMGGGRRPARVSYLALTVQQGLPSRLYIPVQGYGRWYGGRGGGGRGGFGGGGPGGGGRYGGGRGFQAPDAAANSLRQQGYSNVNPLQRRGSSYVGEATGPQGQRQRVIIDGSSGRVIGGSSLGPPVEAPPPGGGWYGGY